MDPATQAAIDNLTAEVTAVTSVDASALAFVQGVPALIAAAVAAAGANGATAAELQPLTDLGNALKAQSDQLAAAITANTPAARRK